MFAFSFLIYYLFSLGKDGKRNGCPFSAWWCIFNLASDVNTVHVSLALLKDNYGFNVPALSTRLSIYLLFFSVPRIHCLCS